MGFGGDERRFDKDKGLTWAEQLRRYSEDMTTSGIPEN